MPVPTASPTPEPSPTDVLSPVLFGISVHVEGWAGEAHHRSKFEAHRDTLLGFAEEVSAGGGVLTFELSELFMDAVEIWDDPIVIQLQRLGHRLAVHADIGGRGVPRHDVLATVLTNQRAKLAGLGVETTHVSGICSRGPWVEAALAAGFTSTGGGVAYCATSMDPEFLGDDAGWIAACRSPAACHGPAPVSDDRRFHPFHADSSANWMISDAVDGLLIIVSESGRPLPCLGMDESPGTGRCEADSTDLDTVIEALDVYVGARNQGLVTALAYSWSLGPVPQDGIGTALVERLRPYVDAGHVTWIGVDEIEQHVDDAQASITRTEERATATPTILEQATVGKQLPFMVSIHAHLHRDWQPYTSPAMATVNVSMLSRAMDLLITLESVLTEHRIAANFQFSYGLAGALCTLDHGRDFVQALIESGHEIGLHTHGHVQVTKAYAALTQDCGVTPTAASGIQFSVGASPDAALGAQMWLQAVDDVGIKTVIGAVGMKQSPMNGICANYGGATRNSGANALLHSWRIDPTNLCQESPRGPLVVVTHTDTGIETRSTMRTELGNIGRATFSRWADQLGAAIDRIDPNSTWGIVGALPQMMDSQGVDEQFVTGLNTFLDLVTESVEAGLTDSVTASQAASRLSWVEPQAGLLPPGSRSATAGTSLWR